MLTCSVIREMIVLALFTCVCLKEKLGLCSINRHVHVLSGNCSVSLQVLVNSLRVAFPMTGNQPLYNWVISAIISKYSSRPTTILAVIVWGRRPNRITSNLSEVEINICIIVYLFMSFVGHIEVEESPSKILKLINCIFICIIFCHRMIFLHITQYQEAFQGWLCGTISENNLLTRPF